MPEVLNSRRIYLLDTETVKGPVSYPTGGFVTGLKNLSKVKLAKSQVNTSSAEMLRTPASIISGNSIISKVLDVTGKEMVAGTDLSSLGFLITSIGW